MLQYALLHLYGYALSIDDLKAFRVSHITPLCWCAPYESSVPDQSSER